MLLKFTSPLIIIRDFCIHKIFKLEMDVNNTEKMVQYLEKSVSEVLGLTIVDTPVLLSAIYEWCM